MNLNLADKGMTMTKDDDASPDLKDQHSANNLCAQMISELKYCKGFSLSRIAKRCGVSPSSIRNIASGNVKTPRLPLLKKILILHCKVFNSDYYKKGDDNDKK